MINRGSIAKSIHGSDEDLNLIIQSFLDGKAYYGSDITVEQWRLDHYVDLRRWAYPDISEYNDAQVKINSGITELEAQGVQQNAEYVQACMDIKTRFPKE